MFLTTRRNFCRAIFSELNFCVLVYVHTACIQHAYSIQGVPVLRSELTSKQLRGTYATRAPHLPMVGPRRRTNSRNSGHYFRIFVRSKLRQSQILVFARVNESSPRRAGCSVSKINAIVASAEKWREWKGWETWAGKKRSLDVSLNFSFFCKSRKKKCSPIPIRE